MSNQEELNRVKQFWDQVGHDFVTPLTVLEMQLDFFSEHLPLLLEAYEEAQETRLDTPSIRPDKLRMMKEALASCQMQTDYLKQYVARLNKKVFISSLAPNSCPISVKNTVPKAIETYQSSSRLREKNIIQLNLEEAMILGDEELLHQILYELMSNADYCLGITDDKCTVSITGKKKNRAYELRFRTTGMGISEEDLPYVFQPFYSKFKKIGLGLAFCNQVMPLMKGTIRCDSVDGEYAEFILTLPLA